MKKTFRDILQERLESATQEIFRFEFFQDYSGEDRIEFDKYLSKGYIDINANKEWNDFTKSKKEEDVMNTRVRLITEPISKYTQFEIPFLIKNSKSGEDVFVLDEFDYIKLGADIRDFYIIDGEVIKLHYDHTGKLERTEDLISGLEQTYIDFSNKLVEIAVTIGESKYHQ